MRRILQYCFLITAVTTIQACNEDFAFSGEGPGPVEETFNLTHYHSGDAVYADCASIVILDAGVDSASYLWTPSGRTTRTIQIYNSGMYTVQITTTDSTWSDSLYVATSDANVVYVPNTFSPNGDGRNDFFMIHGMCMVEFHLEVFNTSNTQLIFESNDRQFGWDGSYKGHAVEMGQYPYNLNVRFAGNVIKKMKGTVLLIR